MQQLRKNLYMLDKKKTGQKIKIEPSIQGRKKNANAISWTAKTKDQKIRASLHNGHLWRAKKNNQTRQKLQCPLGLMHANT